MKPAVQRKLFLELEACWDFSRTCELHISLSGRRENPCQTCAAAAIEKICKRVTIQHGKKTAQSFCKNSLELADRDNRTRIRFRIEALHEAQIGFGAPHDIPETNRMRVARQRDTT